jgi:hypothetical protein
MARYSYRKSKTESNKLQIAAHQKHTRPKSGMTVKKVSITPQKRIENIIKWAGTFGTFEELALTLDEILSNLRFQVDADKFERSFDDLGKCLGFECQRPDKEWKEGPDNLWALKDGEYLLVECKSEAALTRAEVYRDDTGQMNNACSWFNQFYPGANATRILIIPTLSLARGAGFNESVRGMRNERLTKLVRNVRGFYNEFKEMDLRSLPESKINSFILAHELSAEDITTKYSEAFRLNPTPEEE